MSRRLGQHFLHDPAILDRIVAALNPARADLVLEIGTGRGTLTRRLARRVGRLVTIEKDRFLAANLREAKDDEALPPNVSLIEGDALSLKWRELLAEASKGGSYPGNGEFKIVGNIPYAITGPLIEKALQPPLPRVAVYLIQREVADRLVAKPGVKAYGALTIGVQAVASVERLFAVRPGSFSPPPAVDSAVVRLTPLAQPAVSEAERIHFRRFVTALFGLRRKQLSRAVRTATGLGKNEVEEQLGRVNLESAARPETLTLAEMLSLYRGIGDLVDWRSDGT